MIIEDPKRALRKLSQVGYYRLSGFWYPCRQIHFNQSGNAFLSPVTGKPERLDSFLPDTSFNAVFNLYLFDKKLRQLMLDAIERIEVNMRSIIAEVLGYHDPLAYQKTSFINPHQTVDFVDKNNVLRNIWKEWSDKQQEKLKQSREDYIVWHRKNNKPIPLWVVIETWDFGTMSKYFEILKRGYQNRICEKIDTPNPNTLKSWLYEINILRNRCAHHTRIWNQQFNSPLPVLSNPYFTKLQLDEKARTRLFGMISVLWFLVKSIGQNSKWIFNAADVINSKPDLLGCPYSSMGLPDEDGFPIEKFQEHDII